MVQLLAQGFNPAYRTYLLLVPYHPSRSGGSSSWTPLSTLASVPAEMYHCKHRQTTVLGGCGGNKGGSYSIGRPGVCCLPTAAAAASGAGVQGGGTVKEGGQKSSLAPGNASLGHLISLIRMDSQGFLFQTFFPLPSSARVQISTVAHPQLLCSVIPWTTLLSAAVVQTPSQGKGLELPSPVSLANVVLLDEYKKAPVSTSYGYFRSTVVRSTIMNSSIFFLLHLAI